MSKTIPFNPLANVEPQPSSSDCHPPSLQELFPFDYQGGGYFRRKGVPKGETAEILHGQQAIDYLYAAIYK